MEKMKQEKKTDHMKFEQTETPKDHLGLKEIFTQLKPEDHACLIYESDRERQIVVAAFLSVGLEQNDKCMLITGPAVAEGIRTQLKESGIDVPRAERAGQFFVLNERAAYTREGSFDPDDMIDLLARETRKAVAEGFRALRVSMDLRWMFKDRVDAAHILAYGQRLNQDLFAHYPCLALCLFDRKGFDGEIIKVAIMTHPLVVHGNRIYQNFYTLDPEVFISGRGAEEEVACWLHNLERERKIWEDLRERETNFRAVTEEAHEGIAVVAEDGSLLYANRGAAEITGYTVDELLRKKVADIVPADDIIETMERLKKRLAGADLPTKYESRLVNKEGRTVPIELVSSRVTWNGRWADIVHFRDISERKLYEWKLSESEHLYRTLAEGSFAGVYVIQDGKFQYLNHNSVAHTGYTVEDLLGKESNVIVHPEDRERLKRAVRASLRGEKTTPYEFRAINKNGQIRYFIGTSSPITWRGREAILGNCLDITERIQMEESLLEAHKRLSDIIDFLPDAALIIDVKGRVVAWNRAIERMTGVFREEILGKGDYAYAVPFYGQRRPMLVDLALLPDEEWEKSYYDQVQRDGDTIFTLKIVPQTYGGRGAYLLGVATRLYNRQGRVIGAIETIRDITDHKRAEKQIRDNITRLQSMLAIIQYPSESEQELLDYVLEETLKLTGSKFGFLYLYDEKGRVFTLNNWSKSVRDVCTVDTIYRGATLPETGLLREVVRQRKEIVVNDFAGPHPLKGGFPEGYPSLQRYLFIPVFSSGRIVAVIALAGKEADYDQNDIVQLQLLMEGVWKEVESRRGEIALAREQEWSRSIVDNAPTIVVGLEEESRIVIFNRYAESLTGYRAEEVIGKNWIDIFIPEGQKEAIYKLWGEIVRRNLIEHHRCEIVTKGGERRLIDWNHTVLTEDGRFRMILSLGLDVTEQCRAEEERAKLQEQLLQAQKMESIGRLAAGVAHDFNNILNVILGYGEIVLAKLPPQDPLRQEVQQIVTAGQRAAQLTHQLLAFSRKQTLQPKVTNISKLLRGQEMMLRRLIGEDITLEMILDELTGSVFVDPGQVEQVILNLAVNARDAMPLGGRLIIETAEVILDELYTSQHLGIKPGRYIQITVSDTGSGMNREVLSRIFEPFFTTKEKGKGTGLGLSTVYGIVKQSGGSIFVYSEPGVGSTFKIYLPVTDHKEETVEPQKKKNDLSGGQGEQILVVEDEKELRELMADILSILGYRVSLAADGYEALKLMEEQGWEPDLLIVDVVMPGMSGKGLIDRLRRNRPQIKVLYMSGYTDNAIVHHGVLDQGVSFLQKPFTIDAIAKKIKEVLEG